MACGNRLEDHFVLKGMIPGAMDSTVVALYLNGPNGRDVIEDYVVDGKFELRGSVGGPTYCLLRMNNQDVFDRSGLTDKSLCKYAEIDFFVENGELIFQTPHIDSLPQSFWRYNVRKEKNYSLKGSVAQDLFFEYQQQTIPLRHEIRMLSDCSMKTVRRECFKRKRELQQKLEQYIMCFICRHNNLEVNLHLVQQLQKEPFTYNREFLEQMSSLFVDYQDTCCILSEFWESIRRAAAFVQGTPLREEKVRTVKGDTLELSTLVKCGKYAVVDFWASWCMPCRSSFPHLRKMYELWGENVNFISVSIDKVENDWRKVLDEEKLPWAQLLGISQTIKNIRKNYDITSVPTFLLIDPEGKIVFSGHDSGELEFALERICF